MTAPATTAITTSNRLARLRQALVAQGLDALLISQPENRRYASGFTGSTGWLLVSQTEALFATDFRYWDQVAIECPNFSLFRLRGPLANSLPQMIGQTGAHRVGFEADAATYDDAQAWMAAVPEAEWVPTRNVMLGLRAIKDAEELAALRAVLKLTDDALAAALEQMRPGMAEKEVAWIIESYYRTHGAEGEAFATIVAGGPNGARPHARATDAALPAGEPIVIDMGAKLNGYCGDLTRTVCLGEPNDSARFWEVYNLVLRSQQAAEAAARPGLTGKAIDSVARDLIADGGYGDMFGHSLGHGLGLAVHEDPRFSQAFDGEILPGSVVTVEPGIYLPGWGGVRIEDVVVITENGAEVLTTAPKQPILPLRN